MTRQRERGAPTIPEHAGLIRGEVAVAGPTVLTNVSLWRSKRQMLLWSGNDDHVRTVQWTYARTIEVWSAFWTLDASSPSAGAWNGRYRSQSRGH